MRATIKRRRTKELALSNNNKNPYFSFILLYECTYCFTAFNVGPPDRAIGNALNVGSSRSDSEFITLYSTKTVFPGLPYPFDAMINTQQRSSG